MFSSLFLVVENLWICNLRTGSPTKFADLQFAVQSKETCGLTYLKNQRICDCGLSLRICGFKKKQLCGHLCKFATDVNNNGGKLPPVSTTLGVNLPPVSTVVHLELRIFQGIFEQIQNGPNGILGGLRETDSMKKNLKSKISWHCPFKLPSACTNCTRCKPQIHAIIPCQLETRSHD